MAVAVHQGRLGSWFKMKSNVEKTARTARVSEE